MELSDPFFISSRLVASLACADAIIGIDYSPLNGDNGRVRYRWFIDIGMDLFTGDDIQSGCGGGTILEGMSSLLSFLSACGESWQYAERHGKHGSEGENSSLFPTELAEWASQHYEELGMLGFEIEESECCCVE